MYKFNISAPGTIILHGDHMLKQNRSCIAAALDIRTKLQFSSLPPRIVPREHIKIEFSSINLYLCIPLDAFYEHFYDQNVIRLFKSEERLIAIKEFLDVSNNFTGTYNSIDERQTSSLQAFLYLLLFIAYEENIQITATIIVKLWSDLPVGKGLGSSASFAVCLAACFLRWSLLQKGIIRYEFENGDYKKIEYYALNCEKTIYNSQTFINVFTSVYGAIITFDDEGTCETMEEMLPMKILIINANINQKMESTSFILAKNVEYVKPCVDFIMNSLEAVMTTSAQAVDEIYFKSINIRKDDSNWPVLVPLDSYKRISTFINMNQGLLRALGMSSPNIEIICAIARKYSLASKITSDSEFAFIFLLPNTNHQLIVKLTNELKSYNFPVIKTTMVCTGVRVE
ncbi:hypothetical protein P5V15_009665 [Pogonomyrmex californicus]